MDSLELLKNAETAASEQKRKAREEAAKLVAEAEREAEEILRDVLTKAASEAERISRSIRDTARAQSDEILKNAKIECSVLERESSAKMQKAVAFIAERIVGA